MGNFIPLHLVGRRHLSISMRLHHRNTVPDILLHIEHYYYPCLFQATLILLPPLTHLNPLVSNQSINQSLFIYQTTLYIKHNKKERQRK